MKRTIVNPWTWQEPLGFVHGNLVEQPQALLFLAGQTASDAEGHTLYPDDLASQIPVALENIETILHQSGMNFSHVVRLNVYVTDMSAMMESHDIMVAELHRRGCRHTGTLLGVVALASPGAMIEIEVTAAA
ncbi:MAG: RidA family protein [Gammaproteobacteria bacterium]|nr:RidA family protein [Gammaproteobacteria bacterium]